MPPAKKAVKKTADGNSAAQPNDQHHRAQDLRRAYEHMGRVAVLRRSSKASSVEIAELTALAEQAMKDGDAKGAADLLRASEHFSFAVLADEANGIVRVSNELKESIAEHFEELSRKAEEHWAKNKEHSSTLTGIYQSARDCATKALKARAYHQALEFARAAEALAHVKQHGARKLESGGKNLQLKSA